VSALAVLADGRLASGSADKTIRVWEARDGRWTVSTQYVADAAILSLAIAPHVSVLAAGDAAGRIHFLKIEGMPNGTASATPLSTRSNHHQVTRC
jgi:WD40 repeat protein